MTEIIIVGAILLFAVPGFLFYLLQHRFVFAPNYYPERSFYVEHAHAFELHEIEVAPRITLEGMVYEPETKPLSTVLYFGGKEQDSVALIGKFAEHYPDVRFVTFNYRGYGSSRGRPKEETVYSDALKIYEWANARFGDLGVMGYSLGSSVAAHVGSERNVRWITLVCAFDSVKSLIKRKSALIPDFMIRCRFDTLTCVRSAGAPIYLYVTTDDDVVPISNARNLKNSVRNLGIYKEFSGYNHNELLFCDEMASELKKVFEK